MEALRYLPHVSTLRLEESLCSGCGSCTLVCPHGVLALNDHKAQVVDFDGCMECGACINNCPTGAINLSPGGGLCCLYHQGLVQREGRGFQRDMCLLLRNGFL